jgi:hypothetical protein
MARFVALLALVLAVPVRRALPTIAIRWHGLGSSTNIAISMQPSRLPMMRERRPNGLTAPTSLPPARCSSASARAQHPTIMFRRGSGYAALRPTGSRSANGWNS